MTPRELKDRVETRRAAQVPAARATREEKYVGATAASRGCRSLLPRGVLTIMDDKAEAAALPLCPSFATTTRRSPLYHFTAKRKIHV